MKKKKAMTLLEIMIVIFLIGLIGSVIGYSMKGSLDEGRVFKSERAIEQIHSILELEVAKGVSIDVVVANAERYLRNSGMVKDPRKMLKDGWDQPFIISVRAGRISVVSRRLDNFKRAKRERLGTPEPSAEEEEAPEQF